MMVQGGEGGKTGSNSKYISKSSPTFVTFQKVFDSNHPNESGIVYCFCFDLHFLNG